MKQIATPSVYKCRHYIKKQVKFYCTIQVKYTTGKINWPTVPTQRLNEVKRSTAQTVNTYFAVCTVHSEHTSK